jgi:hypothetical protein
MNGQINGTNTSQVKGDKGDKGDKAELEMMENQLMKVIIGNTGTELYHFLCC